MGRTCIGDLEANGLLEEATIIHCGVFKDIKTNELFKFTPSQIKEMTTWLHDEVTTVIFHNGITYDIPLMKKVCGYEYKGRVIDTLVLSKVLNPERPIPITCPIKNRPHSIETWGYRVGRGKVEHNDWETFTPEMLHRCTEDVEILHLVYKELLTEMKSIPGWLDNQYRPLDLSQKLFSILFQSEQYGWKFDVEWANKCIDKLNHIMEVIAERVKPKLPLITVIDEVYKPVDQAYIDVLQHYYPTITYKERERTYVKTPFTKAGKLSANVVKWLEKSQHPFRIVGPFSRLTFRHVDIESRNELVALLLSLGWKPAAYNLDQNGKPTSPKLSKDDPFNGIKGGLGKMIAKRIQCKHRKSNIQGLINNIRPDGRISSRVTGLTNTYRAKHAVIVNIPGAETFFGKEMRKCFTCKEGYKIVGTDSAGCQNRMLAARVNDEFFTKTLIEGKKSDHTSIHFVNQKAIKDVAGIDVTYHQAKTLNYAAMFGASHNKLGTSVGYNKAMGEKIQRAIFGVAPGFQTLIDNLQKEWRSHAKVRTGKFGHPEFYNGWITGVDGRPVFIEQEHTILVYTLQSDEAIMMSAAYCKCFSDAERLIGPHGKDWGMLVWYHDEFQAEVKEEYAETFAKIAEHAIVWAGKYYNIACPHKGESDIGNNWYETH